MEPDFNSKSPYNHCGSKRWSYSMGMCMCQCICVLSFNNNHFWSQIWWWSEKEEKYTDLLKLGLTPKWYLRRRFKVLIFPHSQLMIIWSYFGWSATLLPFAASHCHVTKIFLLENFQFPAKNAKRFHVVFTLLCFKPDLATLCTFSMTCTGDFRIWS